MVLEPLLTYFMQTCEPGLYFNRYVDSMTLSIKPIGLLLPASSSLPPYYTRYAMLLSIGTNANL